MIEKYAMLKVILDACQHKPRKDHIMWVQTNDEVAACDELAELGYLKKEYSKWYRFDNRILDAPQLLSDEYIYRQLKQHGVKYALLDLFSGAGGAARGYRDAGFYVVGVDINPQPRYAGHKFIQADALEFLAQYGYLFSVFHASPPCQRYSIAKHIWCVNSNEYPDLIDETRNLLSMFGRKPYIIENVKGSPLHTSLILDGLMFGLKLFRDRHFESNVLIPQPIRRSRKGLKVGIDGFVCMSGSGDSSSNRIPADHRTKSAWVAASNIDWMTKGEMAEAIPPAYTAYIGKHLINTLDGRKGIK